MPSGAAGMLYNNNVTDPPYGFRVLAGSGAIYGVNASHIPYIANFEMIGAPANSHLGTPWINSTTVAAECALWMCVRAYETRTTDAIQTQSALYSFHNATVLNSTRNNGSWMFLDLPTEMNPEPQARYTVTKDAWMAIETFLLPLFNGTVILDSDRQVFSSDVMQAIWDATGDLNTWIQTVATSMSNVIRTHIPQPEASYNGQAFQPGIKVRWVWITLHGYLVLKSLLTLVIIMIKTSKSPVKAWKGSPLALLFMDVDLETRQIAVSQANTTKQLKDAVGGVKVVVKMDGEGNWGFRKA